MFPLLPRSAALTTLVCHILVRARAGFPHSSASTVTAFVRPFLTPILATSGTGQHWLHRAVPRAAVASTVTMTNGEGTSSDTSVKKCGLVWYKCTDLRTLDHEPLSLAHAENSHVAHLFCFDPRWFGDAGGPSAPGTLKTGPLRARFLLEAVEDLKTRLGGNMIVKLGKPETEVPRLAKALKVDFVYAHREVTSEEVAVVKGVKEGLSKATEGKSQFRELWGNYLYHIDDVPFQNLKQDMPSIFTQFRKAVESKARVRKYLPKPPSLKPAPPRSTVEENTNALLSPLTLEALGFTREEDLGPVLSYASDTRVDPSSVLMFKGGETAGLARLQEYFWDKDLVSWQENGGGHLARVLFLRRPGPLSLFPFDLSFLRRWGETVKSHRPAITVLDGSLWAWTIYLCMTVSCLDFRVFLQVFFSLALLFS